MLHGERADITHPPPPVLLLQLEEDISPLKRGSRPEYRHLEIEHTGCSQNVYDSSLLLWQSVL